MWQSASRIYLQTWILCVVEWRVWVGEEGNCLSSGSFSLLNIIRLGFVCVVECWVWVGEEGNCPSSGSFTLFNIKWNVLSFVLIIHIFSCILFAFVLAAIQCLKRKRLYEQQVEQLGNFQLRIHDQVHLKYLFFSLLRYTWLLHWYLLPVPKCLVNYFNSDDNARRCKSYNRNCWCIENWSSCYESYAESNVSRPLG